MLYKIYGDFMQEIWKPINEIKNYEISNKGKIRRKTKDGHNYLKGFSKRVAQYDMNMNLIKIYPSANEAKRQTGFSQGHISEVCRGEKKYYKNYIWKYY